MVSGAKFKKKPESKVFCTYDKVIIGNKGPIKLINPPFLSIPGIPSVFGADFFWIEKTLVLKTSY